MNVSCRPQRGAERHNIRGFYDRTLTDFSIEPSDPLMRLRDRLTAGLAKL